MPAIRQRSRVCAKASAVSAMIGTVADAVSGSARIDSVAPTPSSSGMCRSISTMSKRRSRIACTASSPLPAKKAWWPMPSSSAAMYWRFTGWSSATSTRSAPIAGCAASGVAGAAAGGCGGGVTACSGMRKLKLLPSPGTLLAVTSPPISRARLREISSPRPVPPWRRERDSSPCEKRLNSRSSVLWSMPMPVSVTTNSSASRPSSSPARCRSSTTTPRSENLTALFTRLNRICLTRVRSARTFSGTPGSASMCSASDLACACGRISASTSRSRSRRSTGSSVSVSRPDSSSDMSSTSFRIVSRWSADSVAVRR